MKITTPELDELMRNADGDEGDVRDALCEVGGAHPTLDAQVIHRAPRAPKTRGMRQRWQVEHRQASSTRQFENINNDEQR